MLERKSNLSEPKAGGFPERFWKFFASVKLALILLVVIALLSFLGVLIPQGWREEQYVHKYGYNWARFISGSGIRDTYHSWWYLLSLTLLSVNLFVCTVERLGSTVRMVFTRRFYGREDVERQPARDSFRVEGAPEAVGERLRRQMRKSSFAVSKSRGGGELLLSASRGSVSRLAAPVIHLGVMFILAGGLVGGHFGFSTVIQVPEGNVSEVPQRDFKLRLEDFRIEYAPSGRVKDYFSTLTVLEGDTATLTKTIEVNKPLRYGGVGVYQSSYGEYPRRVAAARIRIASSDTTIGLVVPFRESTEVPGIPGLKVEAVDYAADFRIELPSREVTSASWEPRNPAIEVRVSDHGEEVFDDWVFLYHPSMHEKPDSKYRVRFVGYEPAFYSGLQVASNPGLPLIWIGFALVSVGLLPLLTALRDERVWAVVSAGPTPGMSEVLIAGRVHRGGGGWKPRFASLVSRWKKGLLTLS